MVLCGYQPNQAVPYWLFDIALVILIGRKITRFDATSYEVVSTCSTLLSFSFSDTWMATKKAPGDATVAQRGSRVRRKPLT